MDLSAVLFVSCFLGVLSQDVNTNYPSTVPVSSAFTEHPGGTIIDDKLIFARAKSPYWLRNDIVVERNAEMIVEPGVTIRVEPQVGITVRGVLTAVVSNCTRQNKKKRDSPALLQLNYSSLIQRNFILSIRIKSPCIIVFLKSPIRLSNISHQNLHTLNLALGFFKRFQSLVFKQFGLSKLDLTCYMKFTCFMSHLSYLVA